MFYIEFIGIPGAGKSTLRAKLVKDLIRNGNSCVSTEEALLTALKKKNDDILTKILLKIFPDKLLIKKIYAIFERSKSQLNAQSRFLAGGNKALKAITESGHFHDIHTNERALLISRFLKFVSIYQLTVEETGRTSPVVFDNGFLLKGMSLFISPFMNDFRPSHKDIYTYLENIPLPDLLISLETDINICHQRLASRPRGYPLRLKGKKHDTQSSFFEVCHEYLTLATNWAAEHKSQVIKIINDGDINTVADQISEKILSILPSESYNHVKKS